MANKKKQAFADRDHVYQALDDLVASFLVHDRREDEDLPQGVIERLIAKDTMSIDDLVDRFREGLEGHLEYIESESDEADEDEEDEEEEYLEEGYDG